MNYTMLKWWLLLCSVLISASVIQYKGLFKALWFADPTGLSFVALALFSLITAFIGTLTYKLTHNHPKSQEFQSNLKYVYSCWYSTELLMAIGMIGTILGIMIVVGPSLTGLDLSNLLAAKSAIMGMAKGLGAVLTTTLVGLITSQLVKIQLINLELSISDVDK